jgi:hypothetical protein
MLTIEGFEAKRTFIADFLAGDTYDCQVVVSEDESEDIEVINQVIREASTGTTYNTVLCVGAETPVFVTPREGISTKSKIILVVDVVPDTWNSKSNVVKWRGVESAATGGSVEINKITPAG